MRIARKTADQANSTVSLADVADLSFALAANQSLAFSFVVFFITAVSTTGLGLAVNGPAGLVHLRVGATIPTSATATLYGAASAYETVILGTGGLTTPLCATVYGHAVNGNTAGNLVLRFRSEVAASAVTIQRGSYGWAA